MRKVFISRESVAKREAIKLKELLSQTVLSNSQEAEFFLTSDWYTLESGTPWFSPLIEQLRDADGVITMKEEAAAAQPAVYESGGKETKQVELPPAKPTEPWEITVGGPGWLASVNANIG